MRVSEELLRISASTARAVRASAVKAAMAADVAVDRALEVQEPSRLLRQVSRQLRDGPTARLLVARRHPILLRRVTP
jgi:hypothetical protein